MVSSISSSQAAFATMEVKIGLCRLEQPIKPPPVIVGRTMGPDIGIDKVRAASTQQSLGTSPQPCSAIGDPNRVLTPRVNAFRHGLNGIFVRCKAAQFPVLSVFFRSVLP